MRGEGPAIAARREAAAREVEEAVRRRLALEAEEKEQLEAVVRARKECQVGLWRAQRLPPRRWEQIGVAESQFARWYLTWNLSKGLMGGMVSGFDASLPCPAVLFSRPVSTE